MAARKKGKGKRKYSKSAQEEVKNEMHRFKRGTAKIKGSFIQQKLFGDKDTAVTTISVETNNGVVTLSGKADNQDQINNAIRIAKSVQGVKEVKSVIQLNTPTNS